MVVTDDSDLAARVRLWGSYGEERNFEQVGPVRVMAPMDHLVEGYHNHLDTLQASILHAKLKYVPQWIERRQAIAAQYNALLADLDVVTPHVPEGYEHVYRNYVVLVPERDRVRRALARQGVETNVIYTPPAHRQTVYQERGMGPGSLPVTERLAAELLCLPMYPDLTDEQVEYVAQSLAQAL
jgi:dTDP-4-amino-4,6-dideoxygalactose transaminase